MIRQIMMSGLLVVLATVAAGQEFKLDFSDASYKNGENPITASGGLLTGRLPVKLNDGTVEFPKSGTEGKMAFQSIDIMLDRLAKKNNADLSKSDKFKVSFELKYLNESKPVKKDAEPAGVSLYNYLRASVREDGTMLLYGQPKQIVSNENGDPITLKDWNKVEIYVDKVSKKCHLLVNGISQGGEINFYNPDKVQPMLRIATNIDCTAPNYLQLSVRNIALEGASAAVPKDVKTAKAPVKTVTQNTATAQTTTPTAATKATVQPAVVSDISKVTITALSDAKDGMELLFLNKAGAPSTKPPPKSWGTMAAGGKGVFSFSADKGGKTFCRMDSSAGVSRMQYGIMTIPGIEKFAGQLVTYEAWVRGENLAEGDGPVAQVHLTGQGGDGTIINIAPKYKNNSPGKVAPTLGSFDWTKITATFRLPERTAAVINLNYLMNSQGILEWKNISLAYTPNAKEITMPALQAFQSVEEAKTKLREAGVKHIEKRKAELIAQFGKIPDGGDFYTPKVNLSGKHPRLLPMGITLDEIKKRSKDPRYAIYVNSIKTQADGFCEFKPDKPNMTVEDPMRGLGDAPVWLAMAYIIETDPAAKTKYLENLYRWMNLLIDWGLPKQDLPGAHCQESFALVYDWLYDELPAELKAKIRQRIIDQVHYAMDMEWFGFYMWRYGQYLANHNWFVHNIMAMGALALWGDDAPPIQKGEVKSWLDEAIMNYYFVENVHSADGYAIEGPLYQDYGLRPFFSLATLLEPLIDLKYNLLRGDAIKKAAEARLSTLLPGTTGFMVYSDSKPDQYSGSPYWFLLASLNNDPQAQYLAVETQKRSGIENVIAKALGPQKLKSAAWRSMFFYNPDIKPADLNALPLYRNGEDLGLYVARSSWSDPKAAFIGIRCGDPVGKTARKFMGPTLSNGHCYPEQGNFSYYVGNDVVIPGMSYAREKMTSNHNLVVFKDTRKPDKWLGQAGEGGEWFDTGEIKVYKFAKDAKKPEIYKKENKADYSVYFADLGCFYFLPDKDKKLTVNPEYKRMLLFLPGEKSIVIVDKVSTSKPENIKLRLLTGAKSVTAQGRDYVLTMKSGNKYLLSDQSPADFERKNMAEKVMSWDNVDRQTVELTAANSSKAIFAVVIGPETEAKNIKVTASENNIVIGGSKTLTFNW